MALQPSERIKTSHIPRDLLPLHGPAQAVAYVLEFDVCHIQPQPRTHVARRANDTEAAGASAEPGTRSCRPRQNAPGRRSTWPTTVRLQSLRIADFTAFEDADLSFSPGLNVFVGENGTGKTHLLKLPYAVLRACAQDGSKAQLLPTKERLRRQIAEKLVGVLRPEALGSWCGARAVAAGAARSSWRFDVATGRQSIRSGSISHLKANRKSLWTGARRNG